MAQTAKHLPLMQEAYVFVPGSGRSPGEGNGYPLQYCCLGNPMDRGAWQATVRGIVESDSIEQLTLHFNVRKISRQDLEVSYHFSI